MRSRRLALGLLVVLGVLVVPAAASASTVGMSGGALHFDAASGEANAVDISIHEGAFYVTDYAATITPGTGCTTIEWWYVQCTDSASPTGLPRDLRIDLGDSDDRLTVWGETKLLDDSGLDDFDYIEVDGGTGDDSIFVPVNDESGEHVVGGAGNDNVSLASGSGVDPQTLHRYALPPVSNAIHYVSGGDGNDEVSSAARNGHPELHGDAGDDHLAGRGFLFGGAGDDELDAYDKPPFGDELDCGPGDDVAGADSEDETTDCEDVTPLDRAQRGYLGLLPAP